MGGGWCSVALSAMPGGCFWIFNYGHFYEHFSEWWSMAVPGKTGAGRAFSSSKGPASYKA